MANFKKLLLPNGEYSYVNADLVIRTEASSASTPETCLYFTTGEPLMVAGAQDEVAHLLNGEYPSELALDEED
ncbi:hypothetical protein LJR225_000869 [Phenylobacterium sp. LjRoot225]|uniref:hypothetical protein n=1 Tax=Phenylobacterium sp. LjRoot225 TaxID=3342285 RepID=UPI003ECF1750